MRFVSRALLAAALGGVAVLPLSAQTQLTDRSQISGGSTLDWSLLGGDQATPSNPFSAGIVGQGSTDYNFWVLVAGSDWSGGFTTGEFLLFNGYPDEVSGTYTDLLFNSPLTAFGAQIWSNFPTDGTFTVEAFNSGSLVGSFDIAAVGGSDANNGQAPFFGISVRRGI